MNQTGQQQQPPPQPIQQQNIQQTLRLQNPIQQAQLVQIGQPNQPEAAAKISDCISVQPISVTQSAAAENKETPNLSLLSQLGLAQLSPNTADGCEFINSSKANPSGNTGNIQVYINQAGQIQQHMTQQQQQQQQPIQLQVFAQPRDGKCLFDYDLIGMFFFSLRPLSFFFNQNRSANII